ncbi:SDR family oxidoreductase [Lysinibacillus sp. OL1_EC]|uniref:SDR family oxidoreductase n=1 Tax=unclassified Lysinibacillus TaxID=2636778 RepID=UPI00103B40ED|nr:MULTISPECIES: SDR family oxidoreductase [unclassified Lysinibacillus]MCM0623043.1 SDR family oxidoreductase [Lysinibacillus sp. OL1_EC]MCS5499744.1 SDR family oxidoreductase [Lysinibacillus sp. A4]TBV90031.1 SDR family oxidoreductase [Lysinibacillus sp. OL1]UKJ47161.1 SDR family oxidoreductase [Lysinibacillus sp. ACHW1.5]WGT41621.1 SDR family oxidoreductase [Lysinibacillus sp. 1 U-2021]
MGNPHLTDPRKKFHTEKFPNQEQNTPALQRGMIPKPDCGEESYKGYNRLGGRNALITGGDSGIGRAAAIAYAREGANVAIQFFPGEEEDANVVKELIEKAGRKALLLPYDLREDNAATEIVTKTIEAFGGLDILVLNAAQQIAQPSLSDLTIKQVQDTFKVNIISMFETVKAAEEHLEPGSAIITTTSVQSFDPSSSLMDYAATKGAISNFMVSLSSYFASKGVRVNGVAPGPIWTPLQLDNGKLEGEIPEFGQNTPLGRAGQPVELAPVYVLLASDEGSYITGQIYGVTGGKPIDL